MRNLSRPLLLFALWMFAGAGCGDEDPPAGHVALSMPAAEEEPAADTVYGAGPLENLRVTPVEVEVPGLPPGWEGLRVAAISDLQLGLWAENEAVARAAVERAAAAADAVVLLGDFLGTGGDLAALDRVLAPLQGKPAFAVLGDRDVPNDSAEARLVRALAARGVNVLGNSRAPLVRGGDSLFIAGIRPGLAGEPDWRQAEVLAALGGTPGTPLLLAHQPNATFQLPSDRFSLVLAGGTVCGEVNVPGTPRLASLQEQIAPVPATHDPRRLFRIRGNPLLVSCGVGYSFLPARFSAPPEVLLLTLRGPTQTAEPQSAQVRADSLPAPLPEG